MHQGWERAGRPPAGWMSPAFFAAALVHGLRGEDDEYTRWMELGTSVALKTGLSSCRIYVECRGGLHQGAIERAGTLAMTQESCGGYYDPYREAVLVETAVVAESADAE